MTSQLLLRFEPGSHGIERASDLLQKGRSTLDELRRVVPPANSIRGADDVPQREADAPHAAEEDRREDDQDEHDHAEGDDLTWHVDPKPSGKRRQQSRQTEAAKHQQEDEQPAHAEQERATGPMAVPATSVRRPGLVVRPPWRTAIVSPALPHDSADR
jgi:hypothetical protein